MSKTQGKEIQKTIVLKVHGKNRRKEKQRCLKNLNEKQKNTEKPGF